MAYTTPEKTPEKAPEFSEYRVRCLREQDLNKIFNVSNTVRKEIVKSPDFPKFFKLNQTLKVWNANDVYAWLERRQREYSAE